MFTPDTQKKCKMQGTKIFIKSIFKQAKVWVSISSFYYVHIENETNLPIEPLVLLKVLRQATGNFC